MKPSDEYLRLWLEQAKRETRTAGTWVDMATWISMIKELQMHRAKRKS